MSAGTADAMKSEQKVIEVPAGTREIGNEYADDKTVTEVILPAGIRKIGDGAFRGCSNLRRINLPEGLTHIGEMAFLNCASLTLPPLPVSLSHVGDGAFGGCLKIRRFRQSSRYGKYTVKKGCIYGPGDELVQYPAGKDDFIFDIPPGTRSIRDLAFFGTSQLNVIVLNEELEKTTGRQFLGCPDLTEVGVSIRNPLFSNDEGMLTDAEGSALIFLAPARAGKEFALRDVERVGPWSLAACTSMKHLTICDDIDEFDPLALGDSVKLRRISVEPDVECSLPFVLKDGDGKVLPPDGISGFTYRLVKKGEFVREGPCERSVPDLPPGFEEGFGGMFGEMKRFEPISVKGCGFDDVIGLDDVKLAVRRQLILPQERPDLFELFGLETGTGVLMYGPPGTGKTMVARAIAQELDAQFFSVKPSDILERWVGADEMNIRMLFESAREHERQVIFFDDFDTLGMRRGTGREWNDSLVTEILTQMQGVEEHKGTLLVLAATNRPWALDTALIRSGRFGIHLRVDLPGHGAREAMFRRKLSGIPIAADIDYGALAERTEGYNGADIEGVCSTAKTLRIEDIQTNGGPQELCMEDLEHALGYVKPTVSEKDVDDIEWFSKNGRAPPDDGEYRPRGRHERVPGYN